MVRFCAFEVAVLRGRRRGIPEPEPRPGADRLEGGPKQFLFPRRAAIGPYLAMLKDRDRKRWNDVHVTSLRGNWCYLASQSGK